MQVNTRFRATKELKESSLLIEADNTTSSQVEGLAAPASIDDVRIREGKFGAAETVQKVRQPS